MTALRFNPLKSDRKYIILYNVFIQINFDNVNFRIVTIFNKWLFLVEKGGLVLKRNHY